jgi:hypothetical protein
VIMFLLGSGALAQANEAKDGASASAPPSCGPFSFMVRQDFTEVSLFDCPASLIYQQDVQHAVGSRVSLTFDELAHTTSASVDGLALGVWRPQFDGTSAFRGLAAGPYVQGNGMDQFATPTNPSKTTDTFTAGGYLEFAVADLGSASTTQTATYFRFRGGETFGNSGIGSNTFVGEWIPVIGGFNIGLPSSIDISGTPIGYTFSPELMVQYDQLVYGPNKYLLFATRPDAFRVGPEIVLKLWVYSDNITDQVLRKIAQRTTITVTYHASTNVYSGRSYSWLQPVLTYNLTDDGNFALSASYGYGNAEATGNMTSQIKLGLAAKF